MNQVNTFANICEANEDRKLFSERLKLLFRSVPHIKQRIFVSGFQKKVFHDPEQEAGL